MIELKGKYGEATVYTDLVDEASISQIISMLNHEITKNTLVKMMPDVHAGKGSTIGTTIKLPERFEDWKVSPNVVGVDVGCGVKMYKLGNKYGSIDLAELDKIVHKVVPSGFNVHNNSENDVDKLINNLTFNMSVKISERVINSLGTLGGGNHFVELGVDEEENYWLSVHSGSRNLGVQVARTHQDKAIDNLLSSSVDVKKAIENLKASGRHSEIQKTIEEIKRKNENTQVHNKDLAYLTGSDLKDYLNDMDIAQKYASRNRAKMLDNIVSAMGFEVVDKFDSVHNFIEHDNYKNGIIRKGATSAKSGERLVIPLNMRDGSIIAKGKGNIDWNESAPHGAGRVMSRSRAKHEINIDTFEEQMKDVFSSTVGESTLDEAPDAYKPAEVIKANIADTASVVHLVKPIYNFKAK